MDAKADVKQVTIEATVIRANGEIEPLGVVSDSSWRRGDPRRLLAAARTRDANRKAGRGA